jgi:hypothetical protein
MYTLKWNHNENVYVLNTKFGKAVIEEIKERNDGVFINVVSRYQYLARFEPFDGDVIYSEIPFNQFEEAESWLLYGVIFEIEQSQEEENNVERLVQTLHHSKQILPKNIHPTHLQRLELIEKILRGERFNNFLPQLQPETKNQLDWLMEENKYYANTPHGKGIITENKVDKKWYFGDPNRYKSVVEHPSGAIVGGYKFSNFESAESWIIQKLYELDNPTGTDTDLENLAFTIQICIGYLPIEEDLIHFIRLSWIEVRLAELLL